MKLMEKRFNSLECLPGSEPAAPATVIRKMNSLQFETDNSDPGGPEERSRGDINSNAGGSRVDPAVATETTSASPTPSTGTGALDRPEAVLE